MTNIKIEFFIFSLSLIAWALALRTLISTFWGWIFSWFKGLSVSLMILGSSLALFVSTQIFGTDILYALPTGAYALIMYVTGLIFVFFLKNKS